MVLEEAQARSLLSRLSSPVAIEHPIYELLELAAEMKAFKEELRDRLTELNEYETTDKLNAQREKAVVLLYERSLDRLSRHLVELAKLDIQTKSLRLQQSAAQEVMEGLVKALHRVGLGDYEEAIRTEFAKVLREIRSDAAVPDTIPA